MCQNLNQSVSGDNGSNGTIVFVYGIGPHTNEDQLWDLFKSFGNITVILFLLEKCFTIFANIFVYYVIWLLTIDNFYRESMSYGTTIKASGK